ncbi:MAG TPA: RNA pseudouridine synthase, partial [Flavobacteriales bacterium]|nr:RNA pseudouridine synthase [Flavobacteriales bacterium]
AFVKIDLHTGRFHQIRASFSGIGCPLVNDSTYGAKKVSQENSIKLVACELRINHPKSNSGLEFSI